MKVFCGIFHKEGRADFQIESRFLAFPVGFSPESFYFLFRLEASRAACFL